MDKQEHLTYLLTLKESQGQDLCSPPKREGAFFFGMSISYDDYINKYTEKCSQKGWL